MPLLRDTVVPFRAADGFECNLIHVEGEKPATKGPVLLVHGAGVRANIFRAPTQENIVSFLISHSYDVWLENWRGSIDLPPNQWTLDQAAVLDHPVAVRMVAELAGGDEVKALIHCQGSTSFTMAAVAGLLPQVKTIISNAVSLHTVVPDFSAFKIKYALPLIESGTRYLDPQWGLHAPTMTAKVIDFIVQVSHHECNNPVCKEVSFTYGSGHPALWRHENLSNETHEWLKQEFKKVPLTFFEQMKRCINRGHLISVEGRKELPEDFLAQAPRTDARFAFFAGRKNLCFLPQSQISTYNYFDSMRPNYHSLYTLPGYSHLDVFMGSNAARDVFPLMLAELDKP
jgi:pimeloyl-ACP methyl ester carboxylesterase